MSQLIWSAESLFPFLMWVSSSRKKCFFRPSSPLSCHFDIGWFGISWGDTEARTYCFKIVYLVSVLLYSLCHSLPISSYSYLLSMCFDFLWDWMLLCNHIRYNYTSLRDVSRFCELLVKTLVLWRCVIFKWTFGGCLVITFVTVILYSEMLWRCVTFEWRFLCCSVITQIAIVFDSLVFWVDVNFQWTFLCCYVITLITIIPDSLLVWFLGRSITDRHHNSCTGPKCLSE